MHIKYIKIYLIMISILFLTACGSTKISPPKVDEPTTSHTKLIAKAEAETHIVEPHKEVILSAENSTIEGNQTVNYLWITKKGEILGRKSILHWEAPEEEGDYDIILILNFQKDDESTSQTTITVKKPKLVLDINDSTFSTIKKMMQLSKEGTLDDVTYLCVGDSTRVYTFHDGIVNHSEKIFEEINNTLINYNVSSYLLSQGGLSLKTLLGGDAYFENDSRAWLHIQEVIDKIPTHDGHTSIIDISLAANDLSGLTHLFPADQYTNWKILYHDEIKRLLKETIRQFREAKPQVKIMLTVPNPGRDWDTGPDIYQAVYKEVAQEEHLPLVNFVDEIMPPRFIAGTQTNTEGFLSWYHDNIHFNQDTGLPKVANFILKNILPSN